MLVQNSVDCQDDSNSKSVPYTYITKVKYETNTGTETEPSSYDYLEVNDSGVKESDSAEIDPIELTEPRVDHCVEVNIGGSLVRLKPTEINPLKNSYSIEGYGRGDRKEITTFTNRSRIHLLKKLSCINQNRIKDDRVLFITLTLPQDPYNEFKKYLNHFLTQLRKRLDGLKWFYVWKAEFQERGVPHVHLIVFNVGWISHKWIRHTWSRMVLGYERYKEICNSSDDEDQVFKRLVITDIEKSRNWGSTQKYFSKQLAYVGKNDEKEMEKIEKFNKGKPIGRFWGIGKNEVYRNFVNKKTFNLSKNEWYTLRRVLVKYLKSTWKKRHGTNFDEKGWRSQERYLLNGTKSFRQKIKVFNPDTKKYTEGYKRVKIEKDMPELWVFMSNVNTQRLLHCLFPDRENVFLKPISSSLPFKEWVKIKEQGIPSWERVKFMSKDEMIMV